MRDRPAVATPQVRYASMLRMADGPVANLPPGFDAYAGYVNRSGIGQTFPGVVAKYPDAQHLSITTDGIIAMCADVEKGAMSEWTGYTVGYCSVANVNALVREYGRPHKLWTAHYDAALGAHICSPACWPGLVTTADGTQWIDHGGWDESLLAPDFFTVQPLPPEPAPTGGSEMLAPTPTNKGYWVAKADGSVYAYGDAVYANGINNSGPNGTSAMISGDSCTGIAACPTGGYWLSTAMGHVYAFGGAPFFGPDH
jgi:hypothetical protein